MGSWVRERIALDLVLPAVSREEVQLRQNVGIDLSLAPGVLHMLDQDRDGGFHRIQQSPDIPLSQGEVRAVGLPQVLQEAPAEEMVVPRRLPLWKRTGVWTQVEAVLGELGLLDEAVLPAGTDEE